MSYYVLKATRGTVSMRVVVNTEKLTTVAFWSDEAPDIATYMRLQEDYRLWAAGVNRELRELYGVPLGETQILAVKKWP